MLEATPGRPWGIGFNDLLDVERDMKWRSVSFLPALGLLLPFPPSDSSPGERSPKIT